MEKELESLITELHDLWQCFDRDLRQGKLKHLDYDSVRKKLSSRKLKLAPEETLQANFSDKLPVPRYRRFFLLVNGECNFLSALTSLQPQYAKKLADDALLMAVIMVQRCTEACKHLT